MEINTACVAQWEIYSTLSTTQYLVIFIILSVRYKIGGKQTTMRTVRSDAKIPTKCRQLAKWVKVWILIISVWSDTDSAVHHDVTVVDDGPLIVEPRLDDCRRTDVVVAWRLSTISDRQSRLDARRRRCNVVVVVVVLLTTSHAVATTSPPSARTHVIATIYVHWCLQCEYKNSFKRLENRVDPYEDWNNDNDVYFKLATSNTSASRQQVGNLCWPTRPIN